MPNPILRLLNKILFFARREKFDNDLAEEMAYHRELKQRDLEASNPALTTKDARHVTNREFGNDLYHRDQSRDIIGFWFETTLQDFRFSLRQLRKNLGFTVTAILMLALGMAASVAIFSFVDAALLKPLPYRDSNRLVGVFESIAMFKESNLSIPDYYDWKKRNEVFTDLEIYQRNGATMSTSHGVEPVRVGRVSDGFFRVLGVAPIIGRDFATGEDLLSAPRTAILSYAVWQKRYGGSPDVLGQSVVLDEKPTIIIGVLLLLFTTIGPHTPVWFILLLAYCYGAFTSIQYTSMNTLVYADVTEHDTSSASSIASTMQQMSISFGVAAAGLTTAFFVPSGASRVPQEMIHGIHLAFRALGCLTIFSTIVFTTLKRGDGEAVSQQKVLRQHHPDG